MYSNSRQNRSGGNVCTYIRDTLSSSIFSLTNANFTTFEHQQILIKSNNSTFCISSVYRLPNICLADFFCELSEYVNLIYSSIYQLSQIYFIGHFNVDLLHHESTFLVAEFIHLMYYYLYPTILRPTRVTRNTVILVGNIFTNYLNIICRTQILSDFSDHYSIMSSFDFTTLDDIKYTKYMHPVYKLNFSTINLVKFKSSLSNIA